MSKSRFCMMQNKLRGKFDEEKGQRIAENMQKEYDELCKNDCNVNKDFIKHAHNNIYPVIAAYKALLSEGMEKNQAVKLANDTFLELMESIADTIRKAMKLPGLYRIMPRLWKTMMPKLFSESSGFSFSFYPTDGSRVKFDMTDCPYYKMCVDRGCPELAPSFCASDDVCYGNMHPKLIWNRSKTIARGGDVCDFDLYIKK